MPTNHDSLMETHCTKEEVLMTDILLAVNRSECIII